MKLLFTINSDDRTLVWSPPTPPPDSASSWRPCLYLVAEQPVHSVLLEKKWEAGPQQEVEQAVQPKQE